MLLHMMIFLIFKLHKKELKKVPEYNSEGLIAEKCKSTAL